MRRIIAATVLAIAALAVTAPAAAAKGGWSVTATDGAFGGATTVTVAGHDIAPYTIAVVRCTQNGADVWFDAENVDASGVTSVPLGPSTFWTGGAADCTAEARTFDVARQRWDVLGVAPFHAAA